MHNNTTVLVAAAVLVVTVTLIIGELLRARRRVSPASVTPPAEDDQEAEDDVTKMAPSMEQRAALPRLLASEPADDTTADSSSITLFEPDADSDEPTGQTDLILLTAAAQSDQGKRRRNNEDAYLLDEEQSLFVVADGMGGYAGGAVASRMAVQSIEQVFATGPIETREHPRRPARANELVAAIEIANAMIRERAEKQPEYHGMGTTIVAARFARRKRRAFIAHVGDSRCYRLRDGQLKLLTNDHTLGSKGIPGKLSGYVRRALGVRPRVKVDVVVDRPRSDDLYLLCSDGLNKMLPDDEAKALLEEKRADLPAAAASLIDAANQRGGKDNVTVILVDVRESE